MKQPHFEEAIRRVLSRKRGGVPGPCPDANFLAAFLEARLTPDESTRFEEHAADCDACRESLALSLQLDAGEENRIVVDAPAPRSFVYRTSPIRLVFGAAVVVVVGALLFQTTRQSQPPLQKPQIAAGQNQYDVTGGPGAAMNSKQSTSTVPATPPAQVGIMPSTDTAMSAQVHGSRPAPKRPAVMPPAAPANQVSLEAGNITRIQATAYADASKFGTGETAKADLQQKAMLNADNKGLKMEMAANRTEEAKAKVEAIGAPAIQNAQLVNAANLQNSPLNQQAASDQISAVKPQTALAQGGRGGGVAVQSANETKQATLDQKSQPAQQAQAGRGGAAAEPARMLALQSSTGNAKDNPVRLALTEATSLLANDPAGSNAKKIGQRLWYRTANYWVDDGCLAHRAALSREIGRDSKEYADILAREPDLTQLQTSGVPILLFWNGANYLIR